VKTFGPLLSPLCLGTVELTASHRVSVRAMCQRLDSEHFHRQARSSVTFVQLPFPPQHHSVHKTDPGA